MNLGISTTGFTHVKGNELTQVEVRVIFNNYRDELKENFDDIDIYEYVDHALYDGTPGSDELNDDDVDTLIGNLMLGYPAVHNVMEVAEYSIPGASDKRIFTLMGGVSGEGDPPFEGFDELDMLVRACTYIPELGKEVGILGSGIVLTGMND